MKADDQIRKIVSEHQAPVDVDALWEQLEPYVPQKKKRRAILWPYSGVAVLLLLGVVIWMYPVDYRSSTSTVVNQKSQDEFVVAARSNQQDLEGQVIAESTTAIAETDLSVAKARQRSVEPKKQFTKVSGVSGFGVQIGSRGASHTEIKNQAATVPDVLTSAAQAASKITELTKAESTITDKTELLSKVEGRTMVLDWQEIAQLPRRSLEGAFASTENNLNSSKIQLAPTSLKAKIPGKFALMVTSGIGCGSLNIASNSAEALNVDRANRAESALENLTIGLAVQQRLSSRWSLNYGLNYGRFVSKIEWQSAQVVSKDAVGVEKIIIDPAGMVSSVPGVVNNKVYQIRANRWFTYHHTFDLPLSVSYRVLQSGRHRFSADAGILLQLYSSVNGAYVSDMGFLEKFSAANSPYARMGIGWTGGLTWERSCSRSYSLLFGLRGTSRTFYRTENLVQYQKDMLTLNVMAGIKRIF